jgi:hypothetical protein
MEDVLGVYTRPYDPRRPQVCLDETSRQLLARVSPPRSVAPGRPARHDYEYQRGGVCNLCLVAEPLAGWRQVTVSGRRTRVDWAHCIKDLVEIRYPDAERIVLVQDNLNTHTPASLYAAFAPAEARRLAERLELHYTPKHGSWLHMAEIELAMLAGQCRDRRLADRAALEREVEAWQAARDQAGRGSTGASPPSTPIPSSSISTPQLSTDELRGRVRCHPLVVGLDGLEHLDEHAFWAPHVEPTLAPRLIAERFGDLDPLLAQPGLLRRGILDQEGQAEPGRMLPPEALRHGVVAALHEVDDVVRVVVVVEADVPAEVDDWVEAEVLDVEAAAGRRVVGEERDAEPGELHGCPPWAGALP